MSLAGLALPVLLVEDNPDDAELLRETLIDAGAREVRLVPVETLREALHRLARARFGLVLLDLSLPDSQGLATVRAILQQAPDVPIVVLTGLEDEEVGQAAVHVGAQDYLRKGGLDGGILLRSMRYAIERHRLLAERTEDAEVWAALARIGGDLMAALSHRILLDRLCQVTAEVLTCDCTTLWVLDDSGEGYSAVASSRTGEVERLSGARVAAPLPAPLGLTRSDRPAAHWLDDGLRATLPAPLADLPPGLASALYLIVRRGAAAVGVLVCGFRRKGPRLEGKAERIADGLVHLAALALDNARLVEALEQSNTIKTYFAATMSHELRNTLFAIGGYSDMLRDAVGPAGPARGWVQSIGERARESMQVIHAALEITRSEVQAGADEDRPIDLGELLAQLQRETDVARDGRPVVVEWSSEPNLPAVFGDAVKLRMVVKNLVGNALKFTERGSVRVGAVRVGDRICLSVADSGIGIPSEELATLFEPFQQAHGSRSRRAGGAGLGLYIVARLVDLLGGTIAVESVAGGGTRFNVLLPVASSAASPSP